MRRGRGGASAGFSLVVTNAGPSNAIDTEVGDLFPRRDHLRPHALGPDLHIGGHAVRIVRDRARSARSGSAILARFVSPDRSTRRNLPGSLAQPRAPSSSPITGEFDFSNNLAEVPIDIVQSADLVVTKVADARIDRSR